MRSRAALVLGATALAAAGLWYWSAASPAEREIHRRIDAFVREFNAGGAEGLAALAHAARLGQFFTEDVTVELGQGSTPIEGRDTVMSMAARLQPRTAAFVLEIDDVAFERVEGGLAEVTLTAVVRRRTPAPGESLDAREFRVELRDRAGEWRVSRVTAIAALR